MSDELNFFNAYVQFFYSGKSCAEYNFRGYKVQRNYKVNCTECPDVYKSTESYRCKIYHYDCDYFLSVNMNQLLLSSNAWF